jgi:integral membrane protein
MKRKNRMNHQRMQQLRWLRWASLVEGLTLVLLVCIAVPMKRMAGIPEFVSMLGPVHGGAFLIYFAMVARAAKADLLTSTESIKLMLVAFIPFGALLMAGMFKRKAALIPQP